MAKTLERMVVGLIAPFDAAHLQIMIDHDWYIVETVRWTTQHQEDHAPQYPPELNPEEKDRIEALRRQTVRMALAALGFSRVIVSKFPRPLVDQYLNVGYAAKWLKKHRPDLLPVLETDKGTRWLQNEVEKDIKPYLWPSKNTEENDNATP